LKTKNSNLCRRPGRRCRSCKCCLQWDRESCLDPSESNTPYHTTFAV